MFWELEILKEVTEQAEVICKEKVKWHKVQRRYFGIEGA